MKDRGIKKWAPFKALKEQDKYLEEIKQKNRNEPKPEITDEEREKISHTMNQLQEGEHIRLRFYDGGYVREIDGTFDNIDEFNGFIQISGRKYHFKNIIDLNRLKDDYDY